MYPSYNDMGLHLNKTNHKVSFLSKRENVGSTTFNSQDSIPDDMQHSFGVPRYFFRFNLTSAISRTPYAYVHWATVKLNKCHRTSFECSMTNEEWMTGPASRPNVNPFCYIEDVIPSRFALGFDDTLDVHFIALDPERVGLENIEVAEICDFGDNVLDYMTRGGHMRGEKEDRDDEEENDSNDDLSVGSDSDDSACSSDSQPEDKYSGIIPLKLVAFLKSTPSNI